ncbi:hypothetical protein MLD38_019054 [Melastoma candidum]|uniref:Uncharacterized protein n=1 Tax=Melastoma candidum TaxID=119954 RepID=A0ACB9QVY6_9MYRT|nr:hypothetical protein MLD38_019054 [Melastoma candidum]
MDSQQEMTVIKVKGHGSDGDAGSCCDGTLFKRAYTPITLKFEDVVYKIKVRKPARSVFFPENSADEEREILRGITGMVLPREIVGVLGPSGSGKTTLLTALGGRLGGGQLEGTVTYNGKAFSSALKRATGFVTQDDTFYPHLTVAETLTYAALLRLPKTLTMPEKVLCVALLCGFLWSQSNIHGLQDKIGLLFFLSSFWGYYPMYGAIFTFPVERPMLKKERSSGMYRLSSYFLARAAGDLPMDLVLPTAFLTITYWMSGMRPNLASFIHTLVTLLYSNLACQGIGLMIGALVTDISNAATLGSVVMMSSLLAGGYYAQKVPRFIAWIQYLSPSFYTYKLLLGSQFDEHSTYPCKGGATCNVREYSGIREVGLGGQAVAVVVLGIMLVGYRVVAYLVLTRVGVTKN